jgi:hypothetical protein
MSTQATTSKPFTGTAVTWDGTNEAELAEFLGTKFVGVSRDKVAHLRAPDERWISIFVGDVIIQSDSDPDRTGVYSPAGFAAAWDVVPQT